MPRDAYAVGTIWNFGVPVEHCLGSEQHDNPSLGSRPWIIVSRRARRRDLVVAVPVTSGTPAPGAPVLALEHVDVSVAKSPLQDQGAVLVEQVRAISINRVDTGRGCRGRVKEHFLKDILTEVCALFEC